MKTVKTQLAAGHPEVVAQSFCSAVSQTCSLLAVRRVRDSALASALRAGEAAECNSAIQQSKTLRYLALGTIALAPCAGRACSACYGQSDSPLAAGMNWGIFSLLSFIVVVLGGVAAFFVFLARRSASVGESVPEPEPEQAMLEGFDEDRGPAGLVRRGERSRSAWTERRQECARQRSQRVEEAVGSRPRL